VRRAAFPRTDPVVIMLVESGERCLLGRQAAWPAQMFSALAGFVGAGGVTQGAVRCECKRGRHQVGEVRFTTPRSRGRSGSLMISCIARRSARKCVDKRARGRALVPRADVRKSLAQPGAGGMFVPPPMAIAHHLIRSWAES
jgi:NAD+ diphosphatase